jgi:F-type H+-transporting ATPase subunit delta
VSAEAAIVSSLAGRYATALFELALEAKAIDAVASDMEGLKSLLDTSDDFKALVNSPLLSRNEQSKAVLAVAEKAKAHKLVTNFLGVLAEGRRLNALSGILRAFDALFARHKGEVSADVVSAAALDDKQIEALAKNLKSTLKQDVKVNVQVDESLLGGMIVKVGSKQIDSSIKTKLNRLTVAMKGAG